jgi:hypothetical protein
MDLSRIAQKIAGEETSSLRTQEYLTEIENLAKNLGAALDDMKSSMGSDGMHNIMKAAVKPELETIHRKLSKMLDSMAQIQQAA